MKLNAELVEKVSKNGKSYVCIEISLTSNVKKTVFLEEAELELIRLAYANNQK